MTREEAIRWLTNEKWKNANNKYKKEWNEAFDLAIEALSVANLKEEFESADAETSTFNKETSTLGEKHQLSHGRLIDADELKKHLDGAWEELNDDGERKGVRLARWYLISAPTVDSTIDVVRCKDCRFWKNEHLCLVMSRYGSMDTKAEHYCSYGERREE